MQGVGHGRSDVTMGIRMSLCEACCHECMTSYMLLYVTYMCHSRIGYILAYLVICIFLLGLVTGIVV